MFKNKDDLHKKWDDFLKVNPSNEIALSEKAKLYQEEGERSSDPEIKKKNYEEALKYYDKAIAVDPYHSYLGNKGRVLQDLGRYQDAMEIFSQAARLDPTWEEHLKHCSVMYVREELLPNGLLNDAQHELDNILTLNPDYSPALNEEGLIFLEKAKACSDKKCEIENYEKALEFFQAASKAKTGDSNDKIHLNNEAVTMSKLSELIKDVDPVQPMSNNDKEEQPQTTSDRKEQPNIPAATVNPKHIKMIEVSRKTDVPPTTAESQESRQIINPILILPGSIQHSSLTSTSCVDNNLCLPAGESSNGQSTPNTFISYLPYILLAGGGSIVLIAFLLVWWFKRPEVEPRVPSSPPPPEKVKGKTGEESEKKKEDHEREKDVGGEKKEKVGEAGQERMREYAEGKEGEGQKRVGVEVLEAREGMNVHEEGRQDVVFLGKDPGRVEEQQGKMREKSPEVMREEVQEGGWENNQMAFEGSQKGVGEKEESINANQEKVLAEWQKESRGEKQEKINDFYIPENFLIKSSDVDIPEENRKNPLGRGAFGNAYLGTYTKRNGKVINAVIKEVYHRSSTTFQDFMQAFKKEAAVMARVMVRLHHPHIVGFYGAYIEESPYPHYAIVMEPMEKGSLQHWLKNDNDKSWRSRYQIAIDIAKGMDFLHSHGCIHLDLKSANILLYDIVKTDGDKRVGAKVADFGEARIQSNNFTFGKNENGGIGTLAWMAPELMHDATASQPHKNLPKRESDVYSYGLVLWELVTDKTPFEEWLRYPVAIAKWVGEGKRLPVPEDAPWPLRQMIEECWDQDLHKRPTIEKVLEFLFDNYLNYYRVIEEQTMCKLTAQLAVLQMLVMTRINLRKKGDTPEDVIEKQIKSKDRDGNFVKIADEIEEFTTRITNLAFPRISTSCEVNNVFSTICQKNSFTSSYIHGRFWSTIRELTRENNHKEMAEPANERNLSM